MSTSPFAPDADSLAEHARFVRALARALVHDASDADDAAQETLVAAVTHAGAAPRDPRAWLAGVLRNKLRMRRREAARRAARESASATTRPSPPDPAQEAARRDLVLRLAEAVRELPEPYQSTVFLRYYEEVPVAEIAARQGVPVATVHTRLRRAVERLRQVLDERTHGDRRAWVVLLAPPATRRAALVPPVAAAWLGAAAALLLSAGAVAVTWSLLERPGTTAEVSRAGTERDVSLPAVRRHSGAAAATPAPAPDDAAAERAPKVWISGVVEVAQNGDRVAGAEVTVEFLGRKWTARTAADGKWSAELPRLDLVPPWEKWNTGARVVHLTARAAGAVPARTRFTLPEEPRDVAAPALLLERLAARLGGRVLDAQGAPVPGAKVVVRTPCIGSRWGSRTETCTTDAAGRYGPIPVAAGTTTLAAQADGHASGRSSIDVVPGAVRDLARDVVLPVSVPIRGLVVDPERAPVEGATVRTRGDGGAETTTGADGRFTFPMPPSTSATLAVEKPGWMGRDRSHEASAGDEITVTLHRTGSVSGRVVLPDGSPAPAGIHVTAGPRRDGDWRGTLTDDGGRFRLAELFPTEYAIGAAEVSVGNAVATIDLAPGAAVDDLVLRLGGGVRVRGQLVDARRRTPIAGARVGHGPALLGRSDADGRFDLYAPEGDAPPIAGWRILVRADGYEPLDAWEPAPRDSETAARVFVIQPLDRVRVLVRDAEGRPVAGAQFGDPNDTVQRARPSSDADGRAELDMSENDIGDVTVTHVRAGAWTGRIPVAAGSEFVVVLARHPTARQQVTDAEGRPLPEAYATWSSRVAPADADGWITLPEGVEPTLSAPGFETVRLPRVVESLQARPGEPPRNGSYWVPTGPLVLRRTAPVAGHVRDAAGRPVPSVAVAATSCARGQARTDGAGAFRLDLPNGHTYALRIDAPNDLYVGTLWAVPGGPPLDVTLPATGRLRVEGVGPAEPPDAEICRLDARDPESQEPIRTNVRWRLRGRGWVGDVPAGALRLVLRRQDVQFEFGPVVVAADDEVSITVPEAPRSGTVRGTICDADGAPIRGARVFDAVTNAHFASTDDRGELVSTSEPPIPAVRADLRVQAAGHAPQLLRGVDLAGGAWLQLRLERAVTLRGRLTPAPGATAGGEVRARVLPGTAAVTDWIPVAPDGTFAFDDADLAPGAARIEILVPGRLPVTREVAIPREGEVVIALD